MDWARDRGDLDSCGCHLPSYETERISAASLFRPLIPAPSCITWSYWNTLGSLIGTHERLFI